MDCISYDNDMFEEACVAKILLDCDSESSSRCSSPQPDSSPNTNTVSSSPFRFGDNSSRGALSDFTFGGLDSYESASNVEEVSSPSSYSDIDSPSSSYRFPEGFYINAINSSSTAMLNNSDVPVSNTAHSESNSPLRLRDSFYVGPYSNITLEELMNGISDYYDDIDECEVYSVDEESPQFSVDTGESTTPPPGIPSCLNELDVSSFHINAINTSSNAFLSTNNISDHENSGANNNPELCNSRSSSSSPDLTGSIYPDSYTLPSEFFENNNTNNTDYDMPINTTPLSVLSAEGSYICIGCFSKYDDVPDKEMALLCPRCEAALVPSRDVFGF